jgi:hypothetical protein
MANNIINNRILIRSVKSGLLKLLLISTLCTANLPVFSASNVPPVISGTPVPSVVAGNRYLFQPTANDANGNKLRFSIANRPAWASFSGKTGCLSGTPGATSAGTYSNIVISVSDGKSSASLPPFAIQVDAPAISTINSAPVIDGTPPSSLLSGSTYVFQPTATDADGDTLTFSIENKPAWASFSASSGSLGGTPGPGDVGVYGNIVISVSDGTASASLPAFAVQVEAATSQSGTLTLSWVPPVARADGTPLSLADISGYRIYYGTSTGNYTGHVDLLDGTAQQVSLTNLPLGTYYMVMTTYDVTGLESGYSTELTDTVR